METKFFETDPQNKRGNWLQPVWKRSQSLIFFGLVSSVSIIRKLKRGVEQEVGDGWDVCKATDGHLHDSSMAPPPHPVLGTSSSWNLGRRRCPTHHLFSKICLRRWFPSSPFCCLLPFPSMSVRLKTLKIPVLPPISPSFHLSGSMSGSFWTSQRVLQDLPKDDHPPKSSWRLEEEKVPGNQPRMQSQELQQSNVPMFLRKSNLCLSPHHLLHLPVFQYFSVAGPNLSSPDSPSAPKCFTAIWRF